jgi:disulfide bond formation protein DsbB
VLKNPRFINFAGFIACAAMIAYALFAQYSLGVDPCALCIFQRIGIVALGAVFLFAGLHSPRGWGRFVYAALVAIAALTTIGIALDHIHVQHAPPGSIPSCGAPLGVLIKFTPMFELIRKVLTGSGECAQVNWQFLGLAMPTWVAICAAALGAVGVVTNAKRR